MQPEITMNQGHIHKSIRENKKKKKNSKQKSDCEPSVVLAKKKPENYNRDSNQVRINKEKQVPSRITKYIQVFNFTLLKYIYIY